MRNTLFADATKFSFAHQQFRAHTLRVSSLSAISDHESAELRWTKERALLGYCFCRSPGARLGRRQLESGVGTFFALIASPINAYSFIIICPKYDAGRLFWFHLRAEHANDNIRFVDLSLLIRPRSFAAL